ncbi:MAG: MarR family transcriptional regulator, partial [Gaiellales bacterium]
MASTELIAALPATAHPMANPGFGKRLAAAEPSGRSSDFAHLAEREAYLAAYIDGLPEGAAIDVKTLAKTQPLYGQQACRSALRELSRVGHLRRVGGSVGQGRPQHVTRTYFSRAARDEEWWADFLAGRQDVSGVRREVRSPAAQESVPSAATRRSQRSDAYDALADLGRRDPRLVLSAAECAELEELAALWLMRGVRGTRFTYAMTSGLPPTVHSPAGLLRRRLVDKLPPEPAHATWIRRRRACAWSAPTAAYRGRWRRCRVVCAAAAARYPSANAPGLPPTRSAASRPRP